MKNIKFRIIAVFFLIFLMTFSTLNIKTTALETDAKYTDRAKAVYLYNIENDKVLFEKNPDLPIFPASTVKIMTGYIAVTQLKDRLNEKIVISQSMLDGVIGHRMALESGEVVSVSDLLYGAICGGYNDAANALAYIISGNMSSFLVLMNEAAAELGMLNTVYKNPTGLHDYDMVTTLKDTVTLSKAAMLEQLFMEISSAVNYTVPITNKNPERIIYNRNELLSANYTTKYYNKYARGLNSGSTTEGGYCLVTTVSKNSFTYLCVVMNADEDVSKNNVYSYIVANYLTDKALSDYGYVDIIEQNTVYAKIDVSLSLDSKSINLISPETKSVYMDKTYDPDELKFSITLDKNQIDAPVKEGDSLGNIAIYYKGEIIATSTLTAEKSVESNAFLVVLNAIKNLLKSVFFIVFISSFLILLIVNYLVTRKSKQSQKYIRKRY